MRILITGATGFIGRHLSQTLLDQGHQVFAWVRNLDRAYTRLDARVHSVLELSELTDQELDAVINLAGTPIADRRWTAARKRLLYSSRIDSTRQLGDFIKSCTHKPEVILSGSAIGYYGSQASNLTLDETFENYTPGFTHSLCANWEAAATELADDKTRICLLRTGLVLGPDGGAMAKMLLPFKLGLGGPIGDGKQVMSWIHLRDWINATLYLLNDDRLSGPINLVSPNPVDNRTFTAAFASAVGRPAFFRVPCCGLKLALGEASELLCKGQRVVPKKLLEAGYSFEFDDIKPALQDIARA